MAATVITEITLVDQERGKEWEYRIVAINKSGEGEPSNTVMAVLRGIALCSTTEITK